MRASAFSALAGWRMMASSPCCYGREAKMRYPSTGLIEQIIRERKRRGITQAELATMLGLPQPSIARIETGVVSPTLGMLQRICDA